MTARTSLAVLIALALPQTATAAGPQTFPTPSGHPISVTWSDDYGPTPPGSLGTTLAFLDSLPHGPELTRLRVHLATPADLRAQCGQTAVLACYEAARSRMTVPGDPEAAQQDVSTDYLIAHEYGHHIAANRSNAPWTGLELGPKFWASSVRACAGVNDQRFSATADADGYRSNPGENWAEVYAHLRFPAAPWTFDPRLRPTKAHSDAAMRDVVDPWTAPRTLTRTGRLRSTKRWTRFPVKLRLDGSLRITADTGGRPVQLRLVDQQNAKTKAQRTTRGARIDLRYACREKPTETVNVELRNGQERATKFRLVVSYAG